MDISEGCLNSIIKWTQTGIQTYIHLHMNRCVITQLSHGVGEEGRSGAVHRLINLHRRTYGAGVVPFCKVIRLSRLPLIMHTNGCELMDVVRITIPPGWNNLLGVKKMDPLLCEFYLAL